MSDAASHAVVPQSHAAPSPGAPSLLRNVGANWLWYAVVTAAGFVLPRLIDDFRGREMLGVWDFAWSLVVFVGFLAFGVSSAVSRYVALHRARGEFEALNRTVNSSLMLLSLTGLVGVGATVGLATLAPALLGTDDSRLLDTARMVVLLLGLRCVLEIPAGVFNGVITGYERFDLLNAIRIGRDVASLVAMLCVLLLGYGLVALAAVELTCELAGDVAKVRVARRVCPHLRLRRSCVDVATLRHVFSFGAKTVLQSLARGGIYQGTSLLVGMFLGPPALALFSRQRALVIHVDRFVKQYAQVFVPRSSALDGAASADALRQTLVTTSRGGLFITLPLMLILLLAGGPILTVWMGSDYVAPQVLSILVLGHVLPVAQLGVYSVLMGMGRHGVPAMLDAAAALITVTTGAIVLGVFGGGLTAAALAMTIPYAVTGGLLLPWYACRQLGVPLTVYAADALARPLLLNLPLALWLIALRFFPLSALAYLIVGVGGGVLATAAVYFRYALPQTMRTSITRRIWRTASRPLVTAESLGPRRLTEEASA